MQRQQQTNEQLCALARQGDRDAQNLLIENNLGFIRKTAYEIWSTQKELNEAFHIDMDDLIQEGTWSLFGCIDRFDPAKEFQFITYAAIAVRNAMLDYIRSQATTFEARYLNSIESPWSAAGICGVRKWRSPTKTAIPSALCPIPPVL